jgi:hypothetical protein
MLDSGYLARLIISSMTAAQYAIRASDWNGGEDDGVDSVDRAESGSRSGIGEKLRTAKSAKKQIHDAKRYARPISVCTCVEQFFQAIHIQLVDPFFYRRTEDTEHEQGSVRRWEMSRVHQRIPL